MSSKMMNVIGIIATVGITVGLVKFIPEWIKPPKTEPTPTAPTNNGQTTGNNPDNFCDNNPHRTTTTFAQSYRQFRDVPGGMDGNFKYGGSTTLAPIRGLVDPAIMRAIPTFKLQYTHPKAGQGTPGSSTGIRMLLGGDIDFSHSSRQLKNEEIQEGLKQIPIAIDGLVFAVNPQLEIEGLTIEEIKDIYTGKIKNWQEVGGPNLKITPYTRHPNDGGTVEYFIEVFLEQKKDNVTLGNNTVLARDTTDGLRKVAADLGGIYYASAPEVVSQCKVKSIPIGLSKDQLIAPYQTPLIKADDCQDNNRNQLNFTAFKNCQYPNTRELYVIVNDNDPRKGQVGEYYANLLLTDEGQDLIEKANFLKIR